jgi:hypothetical protein
MIPVSQDAIRGVLLRQSAPFLPASNKKVKKLQNAIDWGEDPPAPAFEPTQEMDSDKTVFKSTNFQSSLPLNQLNHKRKASPSYEHSC